MLLNGADTGFMQHHCALAEPKAKPAGQLHPRYGDRIVLGIHKFSSKLNLAQTSSAA
jgi:hypothetical protein